MSEEKKGELIVAKMSREDQEKYLLPHMKDKKYQVTVVVGGKTKYAYCNVLSELDPFIRAMKGRIIKVVELNKE